jgi:pimeloyl-ACP methyl ester carboxylesterase
MSPRPRVLFLPGAGGAAEFWTPVAQRLPPDWETVAFSWPGLGDEPGDPAVTGLDDLVDLVAASLTAPADLVAQSMGGIVALRLASRHPDAVRRLVLVATSGGFDLGGHAAQDWRGEYRRAYPRAAAWITAPIPHSGAVAAEITAATLLVWGDRDPISPVTVGEELATTLPSARLTVIPGGTHDLAYELPDVVAPLIVAHLGRPVPTAYGSAG